LKIIGIETATEVCGVSFMDSNGTTFCKEEVIPREHARSLPLFFEDMRARMGCELNEIDGIAISIGPGSFTGLRIGLSYAKGLAYSQGLPIIPVPTLEAMASQINCDSQFNVLLFSHRDMIYHQSFSSDGSPNIEVAVSKWSDLEQTLESETIYHSNCSKFLQDFENVKEVKASAENVCALALKHFNDWVNNDPYMMVPNYIAPFEMNTP